MYRRLKEGVFEGLLRYVSSRGSGMKIVFCVLCIMNQVLNYSDQSHQSRSHDLGATVKR